MTQISTSADLLRQIRESAGAGYRDRAHQRSFSLNVFQMNAVELIEAVQRVKDPDQGMALMMEKNREASLQAHRELNRHVHNFVSASLTLVEHTRVFMRTHYEGTELLTAYEGQVLETFGQSPVAQFVQGLRNYMLHRGLPNSSMFLKFESSPGAIDGSGQMETGVQYETASLLEWNGWKAIARGYLSQAGKHLDLHDFVEEYLTLVNQFQGWLDGTLAKHHNSDLRELDQLQTQLQAINPINELESPIHLPDSFTVEPFELAPDKTAELGKISVDLLGKIRELHFKEVPQQFKSERLATHITDKDLIGPITFWGQELNGGEALTFLQREGKSFGLIEDDYKLLDSLINSVLNVKWCRNSLSRKFVESTFFDWARRHVSGDTLPFSESLKNAARESVANVEVWAPIANMEVELGFDFGPVRIEPVTTSVMENFRKIAPSPRPEQEPQVNQLFDQLKLEMVGYAAAVIFVEAEPAFAQERALQIAQDAIGLLTFFSPAASRSYVFNPVVLVGEGHIPTSKLLALSDGSFQYTISTLPKNVWHWRLSAHKISELKSDILEEAASLILLEGLSEFSIAVRASILLYCKGAALVAPIDRLRNCLSALEGLLLKHEMEPRSHSIANRMSFVLAHQAADREAVKTVAQQIYWLLEQPLLTELGSRESEVIATFTSYAYNVLCVALSNIQNFDSKIQFLIEIDRIGLSRQ